ncbi:glycoside hydrolase family 3 C-terminal domain-containing protein [Bifidobacterium sp. ESL0769]|uniref:glycoside hydrolase family 3 protein n=1 Tax=Bifidobacterium sp. ESL0769 TaxID=2983229 RepID=UPI0023F769D6|nr:glycoside hydrolase family 3 protein [Bifidobacterium sp. ESL0769]WEV67512.1 glycoside hydrolase family 3 C-terminal domain-containing protein [Bifidobacterium sp. ESL0769]
MLQINMADVVNVIKSLVPYLVVIGVLLILAIIISVAVNKKTVQNTGTRKLVHSETWLVVLVAIVAAVSMMLTGPMSTLLNNVTSKKYVLSQDTISRANKLAEEVQSEGITMLQNNDSNLPLSSKKVNVFGWASTNPIYSGSGSGAMNTQYKTVSILEGMKNAGLQTNTKLSDMYVKYAKNRPQPKVMFAPEWDLPETPIKQYPADMMSQAKSFSDQAVVVLARQGGEGNDLPSNMKAKGVPYNNNSKDYEDFKDGQSFLELDQSEKDMLDAVTKNFQNVTLVYNGGNAFQFSFLKDYPQIKSVLWCPPAGQTGFTALGKVLSGAVNPSGKTSDTFLRDLHKSVNVNNYGDFQYNNVDQFIQKVPDFTGKLQTIKPTFVNYTEGIYLGYKFYETAAKEGLINYNDVVQFPFGYGMSYTKFSQKMGKIDHADGKISFDVTVKNTGDKAGKDVVESYFDPPYTNGGIEKASTNLVALGKTKLLKPGESQTVKISFKDDDMASYDSKTAKSYVLEKGDYDISINSDAHTAIDHQTVNIPSTITYNKSKTHAGDKTAATNQFDNAAGDVTYLSRKDHFANYQTATAAPTNFAMSDKVKSEFVNNGNYKPADHNKSGDKMPTTGAKNNVRLASLRGKSYNDPEWNKLLDELTFNDMDSLIANGGYGTPAVDSIGKIKTTDADGPAALNNNFTKVGSIGFPAEVSFACSWNKDLNKEFGKMIGDMAHDMHVDGWYAPGMDTHRSPFSGRNFEYFSEDGELAGALASSQIQGAQSKGVYAFMKQFALNDQETNRTNMLCTWANEQSIREIYLKPFEMGVKTGGTTAAMSSFNYIGPTYAGANSALLNSVLRDEWGFHGFVVTDYFGVYGYQNADQIIRNGGDTMLATTKVTNHITDKSATSVIAMRQASKNILYSVANSWEYQNGEPKTATPVWKTAMYVVWAIVAVLFVGLEIVAIRRYLRRRNEAKVSVTSDSADAAISDEK